MPFCQESLKKFGLFLVRCDATSIDKLIHGLEAMLEPELNILFLPANPVIVAYVTEFYYTRNLPILKNLIVP
jgi:hypothetical protein